MKIKVIFSSWGAGDAAFAGGVHDVTVIGEGAAGAPFVEPALVAAAVSAGVVEVVRATSGEQDALDGLVQSQADGEAAYAAAQAEGRWQHGNLVQFVADAEERLGAALGADPVDAEAVAVLERQIAEARTALAKVEEPT